jgi:C4-dicarboxylate-specific signal transduction histidine kinase
MQKFAELIASGEESLIARVIHYANERGYARHTPSDRGVWRKSISGLSGDLVRTLRKSSEIPELSPELDFVKDSISAFGIEEARKHRSRGITLEMFLGLMKYFRQSYHDLVDESEYALSFKGWANSYIQRYFDRIEMGFISEWERSANELNVAQERLLLQRNSELLSTNERLMKENRDRMRAEQQVQRLNTDLERRVAQRTSQLQVIDAQNRFKLKELVLLNRLGSINLSSVRLNELTYLILVTLVSESPLFFDRAMLFLVNERSEVLQGMLGVTREAGAAFQPGENDVSWKWQISEEDLARQFSSPFSRKVRSCRIELIKGRGGHYRAIAEKKVIRVRDSVADQQLTHEIRDRFGINSCAIIPLMGKDRVFGLVIVDNPISGRSISRDDMRFLQLFAKHAGIAIENSMLYSSLEDANRRLHEAQEQLIHGERLATIGEMAAGIAHELKGPMVSIGGFARRLAKRLPQGSQELEYVATIIEEEQRLEKMLTEFLSYSKKTTICYDYCSITDIVDGALSIVAHALEKNRVRVIKSYPKKPVRFYGDCQQLKQVFINLFYNAHEVMKDGGELNIGINLTRFGRGKAVSVKVADSGTGIPQSLLNHIFSPFFTTKQAGTGLGLPISNRIVSNHGGKIRVRNHSDGGAEFTVLLPCQD